MQDMQSDLQSLKRQFALWRKRKKSKRARTPKSLWQETVRLCEIYPVGVVRTELGLDLNRLKAKISEFKRKPNPTFVSVELSTPQMVDPTCEWVRPDGAKLRVQVSVSLLDQLVTSFLGGRP